MQDVVKGIAAVVLCLLVPDGLTIMAGGYRDGNGAGAGWVLIVSPGKKFSFK